MNILFVSENLELSNWLRIEGERLQHKIQAARSPDSALGRFQHWRTDVIIIDNDLSEAGAALLLELARENYPRAKTVWMCTAGGYPEPDDDEVTAIWKRPFSNISLMNLLEEIPTERPSFFYDDEFT